MVAREGLPSITSAQHCMYALESLLRCPLKCPCRRGTVELPALQNPHHTTARAPSCSPFNTRFDQRHGPYRSRHWQSSVLPGPASLQYLYLPAATVLKRWAGETASGVFVHVDESLHGMDVIRAFSAVDYFIQVGPRCARGLLARMHTGLMRWSSTNAHLLRACTAMHVKPPPAACHAELLTTLACISQLVQPLSALHANKTPQENVARLNRHHLALFNTEQTHLWLAFWCDFFGAVLVVATCLFSVAFSQSLGAPNVGLAISNSIQVCGSPRLLQKYWTADHLLRLKGCWQFRTLRSFWGLLALEPGRSLRSSGRHG